MIIITFLFILFNSYQFDKYSKLPWKEKRISYAFGYVVSVIALIYLICRF